MDQNSYEAAYRARKAAKIAETLRSEDVRAELVPFLTPEARAAACNKANVKRASDLTWAAVIGILAAYEESPAETVEQLGAHERPR